MIIIYYKQHITHQQYKSGMCIYIYLPNEKKKKSILAKSNPKKKKKLKWFEYLPTNWRRRRKAF